MSDNGYGYLVFEKVFPFLTLQEVVSLRQVSTLFKAYVENWLFDLTQLTIDHSTGTGDHEAPPPNLILFKSRGAMTRVNATLTSPLVLFLARYCPNLEVLNAPNDTLTFESLRLLGCKLKYFALAEVDFSFFSACSPVELLPMFAELQAFDIEMTNNLFCHKLFHSQRHGDFLQWKHPCEHMMQCGHRNQILPWKTQSLTWHLPNPLDLSNLSKPLADSLMVLDVSSACVGGPCHPFPNLLVVRNYSSQPMSSVIKAMCHAPHLNKVQLQLSLDENTTNHLLELSSSCKQLERMNLDVKKSFNSVYRGAPLIVFGLGRDLKEFNLKSCIPLVLTNSTSLSLRSLFLNVPLVDKNHFDFPNLQRFSLYLKNNAKDVSWLFTSLKNSPHLTYLHLCQMDGSEPMDVDCVKELIGLLNKTRKLVTLDVTFLPGEDERKITYEFNQRLYPNLEKCILKIPVNISLVFCNKFDKIFYNRVVLQADSAKVEFDISNVSFLRFAEVMSRVREVKIYSWPCFTKCDLKPLMLPNAKLILGMHDIDDYSRLINAISIWNAKKITFNSCDCVNTKLSTYLSSHCPRLLEMKFEISPLCRHRLSRISMGDYRDKRDHRKSCLIS